MAIVLGVVQKDPAGHATLLVDLRGQYWPGVQPTNEEEGLVQYEPAGHGFLIEEP